MDWKGPYILIGPSYRTGHGYIEILNTLFRSFCRELPVTSVRIQSIVTPLGAS